MGKFALMMLGLLLIVYIVAVVTPYLAKKIDNARNKPARVNDKYSFEKDELKDIYSTDNKKDDDNKEVNENGKGK